MARVLWISDATRVNGMAHVLRCIYDSDLTFGHV